MIKYYYKLKIHENNLCKWFYVFLYICVTFSYIYYPIIKNLFDKFYSQKIHCKKQQYIFYNSLVEN